ncbi:MAG: phosphatase PAP2 family protein [Clostridia bacterium]|nr:phosphatase PAP2 family protein [Clostridia bacterium]
MEFLRLLESARTPFFDTVMSFITMLGEETLFMGVALIFFWCLDKRRGYYLLSAGFLGTVCIQILKMSFRIPRPWELGGVSYVESAREAATGYSFPSGHTQIATTLYGGVARSARHIALRIGGAVLCLLIAFSRMYLGVHTPLDVGVSLLIGVAIVFLLYPLIYRSYDRPRRMYLVIGGFLLITLANLLFVMLYPFPNPTAADLENMLNAQKVAWQFLALILGLAIVYPLDVHLLHFEVKAVWWAQLLKLALGLGITIAIRALLKAPLNTLFGINVGSFLRYFVMVLFAGILWPMTFRFWSRLGQKK